MPVLLYKNGLPYTVSHVDDMLKIEREDEEALYVSLHHSIVVHVDEATITQYITVLGDVVTTYYKGTLLAIIVHYMFGETEVYALQHLDKKKGNQLADSPSPLVETNVFSVN